MNLSTISIGRPVLAIVMSIIFVLMGFVGASFLGVRQFPDVDPPQITVQTQYRGAGADVIEAQITEPLEESINGIAGIRSITSSSMYGRSTITVDFQLGENLETAANDVRDRVDQAKRNLPVDVDPPRVSKASANSSPVVIMSVQSTKRSLEDVSEYAASQLKERLQTIKGVGEIAIWGERRPAMRIVLQPTRLAAYGLTTSDVRAALQRENVELPTGRLEGVSTELTLRTQGRLTSVKEFEDVIMRASTGTVVRLADVARVFLGAENDRTILKRDGEPMVAMAVMPQPGANQVEIAEEFHKRVAALKTQVPKDIILDVTYDISSFINKAILEVEETLAIAFALVILVIFTFLRSWRATFIPVIAIPVSLMSSFFVMWMAGFSINLLTMLGIVLATGLVVDDAIVVMENIYKRIEKGEPPKEAGINGSNEIYFAIISTTITLAAVFIPIIFLQGLTGRLFREFGFVVASSVIVSAFVSLSLTPMMSTRLLRKHEEDSWLQRVTEPFFVRMNSTYHRLVRWAVDHPMVAIGTMLGSIAVIGLIGTQLKSELAPLEDKSILTALVVAPEGYTFERMDDYLTRFLHKVDSLVPEKSVMFTVTAPGFSGGSTNSGFSRLVLTQPEERTRSQMEIANALTAAARKESEAFTIVQQDQTISSGISRGGLPVQFVIQAQDLADLRRVIPPFLEKAGQDPTFAVVDVNLKFTKPELNITIRRDRARELGVSVLDIADVLQAGFASQRFGYFVRNSRQYQVIGEIDRWQRMAPQEILGLSMRASDGSIIQLADLVNIEELSNPPQLYHYNRYVSATISAGLAPGRTIGEGITAMEKVAETVLDDTFTTALTGPSLDFRESSSSLLFAFALALVLIYLILAAQFESFVDPFTIMLTVPLALAGAVASLYAFGQTLNIFSEIGAIVLIGIVTKNGILIVEFANQLREKGASWHDAVIEASALRFRPILMTSMATILGALPIALSLGAASESRIGMGVVVVGGIILSTFLTLVVIPSLYVMLSRFKRKKHHVPVATIAVVVCMFFLASVESKADTLTLSNALSLALHDNFDIQIARQDSLIATNVGSTSITGFLPQVNAIGYYTDGANDLSQKLGDGRQIDQAGAGYSNLNVNAALTWTVFDGLRMFAASDRAKSLEQEGLARVRSAMSFLVADVVTAYNGIVALQGFLITADSALVLADQRYMLEKYRYDVGTASGVELAQAEIDRNSQRSLVIRTRMDLSNAKATLNTLLSRDPSTSFEVQRTLVVPTLPTRTELITAIDDVNPDVLAAEHVMASASAHVREATSAFMPTVALQGGYQVTRNTSQAGFLLENITNGWNVGVAFRWNIFNGLADKLERERRVLETERARLDVQAVRMDLIGQADRALRSYDATLQLLEIERASYTAAEKNAVVALEKLRVGTITPLEVRQTFLTLLEVGESLSRLEYNNRLSATEILRLSGRLVAN